VTGDELWAAYHEALADAAVEVATARALERSPEKAQRHLHAARALLNDAERSLVVVLCGMRQ
jgi:hypothetical protein